MSNLLLHNEKYLENIEFINISELDKNHRAWYVTGLFYTVLHLIEGYLSIYKGIDTTNHVERLKEVKKCSVLRKIFVDYKTLYDKSIRARYYNDTFGDDELKELYESYESIERYITPYISGKIEGLEQCKKAN